MTFNSEIEKLLYEVNTLITKSVDPQFTEYLFSVRSRLEPMGAASVPSDQEVSTIREDVVNKYSIYKKRMTESGWTGIAQYFQAVYENTEAPKFTGTPTSMPQQPQQPVRPQPMQQPVQPMQQPQPVQQNFASNGQGYSQIPPQGNGQYIPPLQTYIPQQPPKFSKASGVEFAVGGIVLSIFGSILVIAAGMKLAVRYLDTFAQGMLLYAICIALFFFSELFVRPRLEKLSYVFTALSLVAVYASTAVNYLFMENFGMITALGISVVTAIVICMYGYYNQNMIYSLVGYAGSVFSMLMVFGGDANVYEYYVFNGAALMFTVFWTVFPVKKYPKGYLCALLGINTVYMLVASNSDLILERYTGTWNKEAYLQSLMPGFYFFLVSWAVYNVIFLVGQMRIRKYAMEQYTLGKPVRRDDVPGIVFLFCSFIYALRGAGFGSDVSDYLTSDILLLSSMIIPVAVVFGVLLYLKDNEWMKAYFALFMVTGICALSLDEHMISIIAIVILVTISKIVTKSVKSKEIAICDLVLGLVFAGTCLGVSNAFDHGYKAEMVQDYILVAILMCEIIAAICINSGFVTIFQIIYTGAFLYLISLITPDETEPGLIYAVVLLIDTLAFNLIGYFRTKRADVVTGFLMFYHMIIMIGFAAFNHMDSGEMVIFGVIAVIGLVIVLLSISEKFGHIYKKLYLLVSIYLTIAVMLLNLKPRVVTSVLIMLIALISVIFGFVKRQKSCRIFGLALSMLVCLKIMLYDFAGVDGFIKTLMYFIIGVIALAIAAVYLVLEKKTTNEDF